MGLSDRSRAILDFSLSKAEVRSPLRVKVTQPWLKDIGDPMKIAKWHAVGAIRAAVFRSQSDPNSYHILHPSTKKPGKWQLSWFDEHGPGGDVIRDTPEQALHDGLAGRFNHHKLETVVDGTGKVFGKPLP